MTSSSMSRQMAKDKEFKVLFIYPNLMLMSMMPPAIALFSALLKQKGIGVDLFDTTYYKTEEKSSDEVKVEHLQLRPFNLAERDIHLKTTNLYEDLREKVESFRPNLIAMSALEDTYPLGISMLKSIKSYYHAPVVVGGIFPTFAADTVVKENCVDFVCVGEGEGALVELCEKLSRNKDVSSIRNLWVKSNGNVIKNPLRGVVNLDELPVPDFSIFEENRFFRPMAGKVYRMVPIETHRGCPFTCTFCNSPASYRMYDNQDAGTFFRKKSVERVYEELKFLVKKWSVEYVYFTADTFLAMDDVKFRRFAEMYEEFRLPFWMQTRPETLHEERTGLLKEMNCVRVSIGVEHGNEEFRKRVIHRKVSNKRILEGFELMARAKIPVTVNNIIGFPDETRELAFDTIRLNRQIESDTNNAYVYVPYHGASMRDVCLQKGYITENTKTACLTKDTVLNMPQFPRDEIMGLVRTFCLYVKMPESEFPRIRVAEKFDEEGNRTFEELKDIYYEKYF